MKPITTINNVMSHINNNVMLHQTYREDRTMDEAHHYNKQCNVSYKQQ